MPAQEDEELLYVTFYWTAATWRQQAGTCKKVQLSRFNCEVKAEKTRLVIYELWKFFSSSFYENSTKVLISVVAAKNSGVELLNLFSSESLLWKFNVLKESIEINSQIAVKCSRWQNFSLHKMLFSERCFFENLIKWNKSFRIFASSI